MHPQDDPVNNIIELVNDLTILITCQFICGLLANTIGLKPSFAWNLVAMTFLAIVIDIVCVMSGSVKILVRKAKMCRAKKRRET